MLRRRSMLQYGAALLGCRETWDGSGRSSSGLGTTHLARSFSGIWVLFDEDVDDVDVGVDDDDVDVDVDDDVDVNGDDVDATLKHQGR